MRVGGTRLRRLVKRSVLVDCGVVTEWLELRGFDTIIEERPFGEWSSRTASEPGIALCGVDNAETRAV